MEVLGTTESVCPECLSRIPAACVLRGEDVYLEKTCPEHGFFSTVIWRGQPALSSWLRPKNPSFPKHPLTQVDRGCPFDCGLCPDHRQHSCSVLLEVTGRCDLHCPVCFASAGDGAAADWSLNEIGAWFRRLLSTGGPFNIQLSGGEPCMRDDLPEIIKLGRAYGFSFFQLNTNGLRLSHDTAYIAELKNAGLSTIFLQFDGTHDSIYKILRGRELFAVKMAAVERCAEQGIGVVLVPTLVPGINTEDIGNIIRLAIAHMPAVRGVHFQPISYFGRCPQLPVDEVRITLPEVMLAIEKQTGGMIKTDSFSPSGCENAFCSFHGSFVVMPDGSLRSLSRRENNPCCSWPVEAALGAARTREFVAANWAYPELILVPPVTAAPILGGWDAFLDRKRTHTFCVSAMAFQDAWTLDLERLRDCCIHTASPDGRLVPFCAYNLTNCNGMTLYRKV